MWVANEKCLLTFSYRDGERNILQIFSVFIFSMSSKVIIIVIPFMFLAINMLWPRLRAHFNPRLTARVKMSLSRAQNTVIMNMNSIVLLKLLSLETPLGILIFLVCRFVPYGVFKERTNHFAIISNFKEEGKHWRIVLRKLRIWPHLFKAVWYIITIDRNSLLQARGQCRSRDWLRGYGWKIKRGVIRWSLAGSNHMFRKESQ